MFENLSNQLSCALRNIKGSGRLTDENIKNTIREVRIALLEADVALPIVKDFINRVKDSAIGHKVNKSLTPGQEFIKIIYAELINTMGNENSILNLSTKPPATILIFGLQGVGKTTSVGKLGKYLSEKHKKKILITSTDVYRPAAIKQLEILSINAGVDFFSSNNTQKPIDIAYQALNYAKIKFYDVLLIDTAGRLHIDKAMMSEIIKIHNTVNPIETLFTIDAMIGQDAANVAKSFNLLLPFTGIILTKVDGDMRGGAALSIRQVTGKPIKFIGIGEKIDELQLFRPDRLARQILGMGDILSLIEEVENKAKYFQKNNLTIKLKKGEVFDLIDFLNQIKQMRNMGGITSIIKKLPILGRLTNNIKSQIDDKALIGMEAIINSMTIKERINRDIIKGSRKRRIAAGSGMHIQDVNRLLKQFDDIQRMMKKIKKNGMTGMMRNIKNVIFPNIHGN